MRRVLVPALALGAVVLAAPHLLAALERRLTFFPSRQLLGTPREHGLPYEDHYLLSEDGERLHAWWIPGSGPPVVIYLHGNAGNVSYWTAKMACLHRTGASILLVDYRGYGLSSGRPSEEGLASDARAAHDWLTGRGVLPGRIVLWGESLGGAVAAGLSRDREAAGLVLESTFTSARELAPRVAPFLPFASRIVRARFDVLGEVRATALPKLIIHGDADAVIPFEMGARLHREARGPKRFLAVPGGEHSNVWVKGDVAYLDAVRSFFALALGGA